MKKLLVFALTVFVLSCTNTPRCIIDESIDYLSTENVLKYDLKELTIQGNGSDTLLIPQTTKAFFKYSEDKDNLIGFNFIVVDTLVHPYFRIPLKNTYMYDGELFKFESINPMQNETKVSNQSQMKVLRINSYIKGHLPMLLELLEGDSYVNRIVKDTLLSNSKSLFIKQADTTGIIYELFIKKEGGIPSFLRIISNPTQPFIEEYSYTNFEKVDTAIVVQENHSEKVASEIKRLTKGDSIPSLNLQYLTGEEFSFAPQKGKITILCLSMINCGPCQMAVDDIQELFLKYSGLKNIRFVVFYPIDRKEKLKKYVNTKNITCPIVYNSKERSKNFGSVMNSFKTSFPAFIILNDDNKIVWINSGYHSQLKEEIRKAVKKFGP